MRHARTMWLAAETDHRSEALAARSLLGLVPQTYNPLYRERARRGVRRALPVLQGYLLVQVDRRDAVKQLGDVRRTRGVRGILGEVRAEEVERLRGLEDEQGYVVIEEENPPVFAFGESVLVLSGVLKGQRADYAGIDPDNPRRARVALEFLSRVISSSVPRYDLACA